MTRRGSQAAAASLAVAGGTLALFLVSRGRWCDPIIDSGREWMLADALARGDLLYRDVHYWAGPVTIYVQAAFFRVIGSSLGALAAAGIAISVVTLVALACTLRRVTGRDEALLVAALAIPVVVFMPHGGGVLVGLSYRSAAGFALLAIATVSRRWRISTARAAAAGALVGFSGLCRTEFGIAAAAGALVALGVSRRGADFFRRAFVLLSTAVVLFGVVIVGFVALAGRRAVIEDGHLLLTHIPEATRAFAVSFSGIVDRRLGTLHLLYSALLWTGLVLIVRLLASRPPAPVASRVREVLAVLFLLGVAAALGGATGPILFSAAPAVCLVAALGGLVLARRCAASAGFATTGLLLFHRRPLDIGDSWYVGAPLLFALVAGAGLLRLAVLAERRRVDRRRLARSFRWTVAGILAFAFAGRLAQYAADDTVAVPGTEGWIHALPVTAAGLADLASAVVTRTPSTGTLVVFPEGEVLNYIAARRNPIRFKLCLPDTVTLEREPEIVAELERTRPDAIVVTERHSPEYGKWAFGRDYGSSIAAWVAKRYAEAPESATARHPFGGVGRIFLRRESPRPAEGATAMIGCP